VFKSLANPNYRRYAAGGVLSNTGTWMQRVAADWLVLELTGGSGIVLGVVIGLQFLPFLMLSPVAGLVADRVPKVRLLQATNVAMALPALVLGILAVTGLAEVWHVVVLAAVLGCAAAFDAPARQAFVPELVDRDDLPNAVGLNSASFNAARVVGPAVAGVMIAALGGGATATGWVMLINAATYVAPVLALRTIDASRLDTPTITPREPRMIRVGVRYVRSRPDLMLILAVVFFAGTFGLNFQMTSALMATQVFGKGPTEFGLLGTFLAIGSLTGALLAARRRRIRQRLVVGAALAFGVANMVAGVMPTYVAYAAITPLMGITALTMITSANAFIQLNTDAGMRGRVGALYLMIFMGGTPLGAPVVGWVAETFGARWTLIGGGALTILGVLLSVALFLRSRSRDLVASPQGADVLTPVR
jgi:MFS family permease